MRTFRVAATAAVAVATCVTVAPLAPSYADRGSRLESLATAVPLATAQAARAAEPRAATLPGTRLGLTSFADIVADPAHHHVFVSGGPGSKGVVVTDPAGNVQQKLGSAPGASGMVLSPDGTRLYVALADGNGIREIDTSTLTGITMSTGPTSCPQDVAVTVGVVWFSDSCQSASSGSIGALDPGTGTVYPAVIGGLSSAPILASSAGLSGALFAGELGASPVSIQRYDVTVGGTPTGSLGVSQTFANSARLHDLAVTPDGADIVMAAGAPSAQQVFKTGDLSADGAYATGSHPNAVAIAGDGRVAAGIGGASSQDVWLYAPGASSPTKTWTFAPGDHLQPRGLAFAGTTIYAVTGGRAPGSARYLHVLSTLPDAPLTVTTDRSAYRYGARAEVTIHLRKVGSHRGVAIYATPAGGRRVLVRSGNLSGGTFSARYRVGRKTVFTGVYEGGSTYGPTGRTRTVKVHAKVATRLRGYYAVRHGYRLYHLTKDPQLIATVSPNHAGECLSFIGQRPKTGGGWKTFGSTGCVTLSTTSQAGAVLRGTHAAGEKVRMRARWGGDRVSLKQKSAWSYVRFTR